LGTGESYGRLPIKELIDLHVHSNASDGSFPPAEVVRLAKEGGLTAMALTDHDTVDGLPQAVAYHNGLLDQRLAVLKQARIDRNPQIIAKLNSLGIPITLARVEEISGGGQVGRPHIARALMELGAVQNLQEAFDKYLGWRKPAYVSKFRFPPGQALTMIREAQGIPVLAHPFTLGLGSAYALKNLIIELKGQGLAGLEVFYPEHTPAQETLYLKLAQELDLLISGGSDYHGLNKPEITLGSMPCQGRLTYDLLEALRAWRRREYQLGG
jgi:predicted metal-dependent phosphoesterase TrpH